MVVSYGIFKDVGNALKHSLWSSRTVTIPIRKFTFLPFLYFARFSFLVCLHWMLVLLCKLPFVRMLAYKRTKSKLKLKINKRSDDRTTKYETNERRMSGVQRHAWHKGYNLSVNIILWNVASILIEKPRMTLFHIVQRTSYPTLLDYIFALHIKFWCLCLW